MRSFGVNGEHDSDGNAAGAQWRGGGTAVGFDAPVSASTVVGTGFVYARNEVEMDGGNGGVARIKSPQFFAYTGYSSDGDSGTQWQLRSLVGVSKPTFSSDRRIFVGRGSWVARSSHEGQEYSAAGEGEMSRDAGAFRLHGTVGLRASHLAEDGFTESGSLANLEISGRTTQSLTSNVGARAVLPTNQGLGQWELRAMWSHELSGWNSSLTGRLAAATSDARFTVDGLPAGRDSFTLGAGFSGEIKRNLSLYGDYSLDLRGEGTTQQMALAGLRLVW